MNGRAVIVGIGLTIACSTLKGSVDSIEYGPQVVLNVDHSANGQIWVVPQGKVWFRIAPLTPEQHLAPLPNGTNMLCREFAFNAPEGVHIGLKCGVDTYLMQAVGLK